MKERKVKELFQIKEWQLNVIHDIGLDPLSGEVLSLRHYYVYKMRIWNIS